jgi:hypothetical protein
VTLKALYRSITHDTATHQRTIGAQLARESKPRRRLVKLYLDGLSDRAVGRITHRSYGAARKMLIATLQAMHKRIHQLPRYHLKGRARSIATILRDRPAAQTPRAIDAATDPEDGMPDQTPPGGPASARDALRGMR